MTTYLESERSIEAPPEPSPVEWARHRLIRLTLPCLNDEVIQLELLRDEGWLLENSAKVGETMFLNMPEMGVEGEATVESIDYCPHIESGYGRVVTGTFHHSSGVAYDLKVEGEPSPIGVTAAHPIWSVDKNRWVVASELSDGESVQSLNRVIHVERVDTRVMSVPVFNIEASLDHVIPCWRKRRTGA